MPLTIVPVEYGPDYKSKAAVEAAVRAGKDFRVCDMSSPDDGRACNLEDLKAAGVSEVRVRYSRLTKVTIVRL